MEMKILPGLQVHEIQVAHVVLKEPILGRQCWRGCLHLRSLPRDSYGCLLPWRRDFVGSYIIVPLSNGPTSSAGFGIPMAFCFLGGLILSTVTHVGTLCAPFQWPYSLSRLWDSYGFLLPWNLDFVDSYTLWHTLTPSPMALLPQPALGFLWLSASPEA